MAALVRNGVPSSVFSVAPFNRLDTLFERVFGEDGTFHTQAWFGVPGAVWQNDEAVHVEFELPGVSEGDVDVTVHQGILSIRGDRKPVDGRKYLYNSRTFGKFERKIKLPEGIDTENVQAKLTNGVLELTFPKKAEAKPRKISLQGE
jgi:HSP20 family protein